jgi:hypothetical protein
MSPSLLFASRMVAKLSTSLFAANSLFTNTVQHPARMGQPTEHALTEYRSTFARIGVQQASLAFFGLAGGLVAYYYEPDTLLLVPTLMLGSMIPYTLLFIAPINSKLLDSKLEKDSSRADELLQRWIALHTVRTIVTVTAMFLWEYYS